MSVKSKDRPDLDFLAFDLSRIIRDILRAAADRNYDRMEEKAEDLKVWARVARKQLTGEHDG